jgi:penicillin-binding protein 1B
VQDVIVASEDRRFFRHFGFDIRATARALFTNIRSGEVKEGGSTITQQLARGLFLGSERTLVRKVAEIPISIGLEILLDKREILEMYLNMVYWGRADPGGVAGIAEAARWYFDEPVESLGLAEATVLAAMIPAPNATSPFDEPDVARRRRDVVIETLVELHKIDRATAADLKTRPLGVKRGPRTVERFPSYTGHLKDVLAHQIHRQAAETRGFSIFSTMDLAWQQAAEAGLGDGLNRIEIRGGGRAGRLQGAFIALEPGTNAIRAIVGGRHVGPGEFNRATHARRQSGSAIKPIVYAAALMDAVAGLTPASTFPDERRVFGKGRWAWRPRNEGDSYHPSVTMACALAYSLNLATANLVEAIGPWTVARAAEHFGLRGLKPVMSIGLGANEVSLLDLTAAYSAFGNGGVLVEPRPFRAVVDARGRRLLERGPRSATATPPAIAAVMTGLLQNVVIYGVARGLPGYGVDRPVAGKTGTTNEYQDGWFIGYTPHIVAGAWVGYDQPRSLGRAAARTALPVWGWIVERLIGSFPRTPFVSDAEVEYHDIDPWTGYLAEGGRCPAMRVPFLPGTAPSVYCGWASDTLWRDFGLDSLGVADTSFEFDDQPPPDTTSLGPASPSPSPIGPSPRPTPPKPEPVPDDSGWVEVDPDTLPPRR